MSQKRISIVVLGTDDYLKKSLISLILGKGVFAQRSSDRKFENDTYEVTFISDLFKASEDIRKLLSSEQHDMCLLVVEDEFTTPEVQHQIDELHKITKKPIKDFTVVLPLRCNPPELQECNPPESQESYPLTFCNMGDLFNKLREMAGHRKLMLTNKRFADEPHPQTGGADGSHSQDHFTGHKKSLKGNHSDNKVNLVLLGMSGTGKSETGNTILGKRQFVSKTSSIPVTTECQAAETEIDGTRVRVIDTPDIFNDEIKSSDKNQHVRQCTQLICQSDPCVYLLVMHVSRFTDGEKNILKKIEEAFSPRAKEKTILLFTRGEDLQRHKMSLEGFLHSSRPELKNIVDQCGGGCVVFENENSRQPQVTALMQTMNMMLNKQQKH